MAQTSAAGKLGRTLVAGALAFSCMPAAALAAETDENPMESQGQQEQQQPEGEGGGDMGGGSGGGADTMTFDYTGDYEGVIEADGEENSADSGSYDATESDQNAALAENGGTLTLANLSLSKAGDDSDGDRCNFYGVNSVLLAVGENSLATFQSSSITAKSEGSNGIFATDSGTVYATDFSISTSADNSRGLDATYGGTIVASNASIETQGGHCASIATDRGGGYVSVTDSSLSTAGDGSPLLYSTGDIEVSGVSGTATGSQIAGMEGLNTILINSSSLESTVTGTSGSDPVANGVIIYQSTSGDAEASTGERASFQAVNSTLTSSIESGSMFYLTNTSADLVLSSTTLNFNTEAANLILAAGNDSNNWGSAGSNGADASVTAIGQTLEGTVEADTISSVDLYLTEGSSWTGKTVISENSAGSSSEAPLSVSVDGTSTWTVTEDCELSTLTVADGGSVVDADGKSVSIVADGETVVAGDSDLTVTVNGSYSTDYDSSAAGTLESELIDRSGFDETFNCDTDWALGDAADGGSASADSADGGSGNGGFFAAIAQFFNNIAAWFKGLFS